MDMKSPTQGLLVALAALFVSGAFGQSVDTANSQTQDISGEITLIQPSSASAVKDASRVVIWLVAQDPTLQTPPSADKPPYRIVQHNKMFQPDFLVVPMGSLVDFPNLDPWFHNVFSLYRGKKFDLGLYEAGAHKQVKFDRPGASYIFCNIHPGMTAVVLAVDSALFGVSDKAGRVTIANVPSGKYLLRVWYEDATPQALQALERPIEVSAQSRNLPPIAVPVTKQNEMKHKNKFGHDYDPNPDSEVY
jgi:plastocyanin